MRAGEIYKFASVNSLYEGPMGCYMDLFIVGTIKRGGAELVFSRIPFSL